MKYTFAHLSKSTLGYLLVIVFLFLGVFAVFGWKYVNAQNTVAHTTPLNDTQHLGVISNSVVKKYRIARIESKTGSEVETIFESKEEIVDLKQFSTFENPTKFIFVKHKQVDQNNQYEIWVLDVATKEAKIVVTDLTYQPKVSGSFDQKYIAYTSAQALNVVSVADSAVVHTTEFAHAEATELISPEVSWNKSGTAITVMHSYDNVQKIKFN